jgi:uncharacterized protein YyaL (SSP411 family)
MLTAFADAARALRRDDYREIAERNADFLLRELRTPEGRLHRTWKDGVAKVNGYLEDYTHLINGLLELYQTTFDPRWYRAAHELAETMIEHFSAPGGGFYDASDDHEALIVRPRELQDNAVSSGNAMAALVLSRLAGLAVEPRYSELARGMLGPVQEMLARYPLGFAQWLIALDYVLAHPREVSIVGDVEAADTQALLDACASRYSSLARGHTTRQTLQTSSPSQAWISRTSPRRSGCSSKGTKVSPPSRLQLCFLLLNASSTGPWYWFETT